PTPQHAAHPPLPTAATATGTRRDTPTPDTGFTTAEGPDTGRADRGTVDTLDFTPLPDTALTGGAGRADLAVRVWRGWVFFAATDGESVSGASALATPTACGPANHIPIAKAAAPNRRLRCATVRPPACAVQTPVGLTAYP
ncbi:hypothetical protein, partial [Mycolicibacterium aichiense]